MSYISLMLGKRERNPLRANNSPNLARFECQTTRDFDTPQWHRHNDPQQFSNRTERDETQAVGKLFEGRVDG